MTAYTRPGVSLIEMTHVPVQHVTAIGRIDIMACKMVVTLYDLVPGDDGEEEAVIVGRLAFRLETVEDEIQFAVMALEEARSQRTAIRDMGPRRRRTDVN